MEVQLQNLINKKIVVVDDEPEMLEILEKQLSHVGCKVFVSGGGIESIDMIREQRPDLVILDVMMPKINGLEIKEKLNENELTSDIPVIFLTVRDLTADKVKGLKLGAAAYITKPFEIEELVEHISSILKEKESIE